MEDLKRYPKDALLYDELYHYLEAAILDLFNIMIILRFRI
jgi:hypothetical protein